MGLTAAKQSLTRNKVGFKYLVIALAVGVTFGTVHTAAIPNRADAATAPSLNACRYFKPYLYTGVQNQRGCVAALQFYLKITQDSQSISPIRQIDGIFGSQTWWGVAKFQVENGLTVDGKVGPQTWSTLGRQCRYSSACAMQAGY